jgi:HD-GYP domain-containing protein (c-di-GMP phosphodiesterase class II)
MQFTKYEDLVGKRLLQSVVNARGMMLIPVETIISESHIEKLEKFKIDTFDIHVELVETQEEQALVKESEMPVVSESEMPVFLKSAQAIAGGSVKQTTAMLQGIENIIKDTGKIPISDVEDILLPTIIEATQNRNIYKLFAELKEAGDYRFKHSIGVAYIAVLLGRSLQLDEKEIAQLTTAASLCDIGSIKLPSSLLHNTSELDPDEFELMKQHTVMGSELLRESNLDPSSSLVALQHHERDDGSGYPEKLIGTQIHMFSKIVALADVYVAMTSERPQRPALPFYKVIHILYGDIIQKRFDSRIGLTFLNLLMTAQVGNDVILSNGKKATIVLIHANDPSSPLISLEGEFIDLSRTNSIQIMEIIG